MNCRVTESGNLLLTPQSSAEIALYKQWCLQSVQIANYGGTCAGGNLVHQHMLLQFLPDSDRFSFLGTVRRKVRAHERTIRRLRGIIRRLKA